MAWTNPWLMVAGLTLLAFLLRRFHLGAESLWFDEADIVAQARQPLGNLFEAFARAGENGPLYTLMLHFWMALYDGVPGAARAMHLLFGSSYEAPIRGLAMLFGIAGIPAIYALARKIGDTPLALISAALLAINPFHLWYSQDAKMYTLLVLMTLLTTWLYLLALERNTIPLWLAYVVATWIMLTSHSLSGLVLLAQIAATPFLFWILVAQRAPGFWIGGRPQSEGREVQSKIQNPHWIWAFALIILPVFPIIWLRVAALVTGTVDSGNWYATTTLPDILLTIFVKFAVNQAAPWQIIGGFALSWEWVGALTMGALALTGVVALLRPPTPKVSNTQYAIRNMQFILSNPKSKIGVPSGRPKSAIVFSLWLVPVLVFWLVTIALPLFHPRYLIMALPSYLIMAAAGILALRRLNLLVSVLPLVLLSISTGAALAGINYSADAQKEDWRGAISYVQDHIRLRDVIVPFPGYLQSAVRLYYKPGGSSLVPDRPISTIKSLRTEDYGTREMEEELRRVAQCNERAWLIVSPVRAQGEDSQQRVLQWFQYNFLTFDTQVFNGVTVYGISFNSVYNCWSPAPDYEEPHTFENGLLFRGYIYELRDQNEQAPVQPDASYLPLTLFWQSPAQVTMTQDYDFRIRITAPTGEVVKDETLGPLNGYFPTTQWHPGTTYMDYRDVRLPGGLPPGDYRVSVQVHPKGQPDKPLRLVGEIGDEVVFNQPVKVVPWKP
jgi:mannosyltransferase